jgi:hypothetical protein
METSIDTGMVKSVVRFILMVPMVFWVNSSVCPASSTDAVLRLMRVGWVRLEVLHTPLRCIINTP